jgi:outer membrane protein
MARVAWSEPPPRALRLDDAVRLALTRNERARIADLEVAIADAGVARARGAFLPVLAVQANDALQPWDTPASVASGTLTLSQPLLVPSAWPLLDQAKHRLAAQRAQRAADKRRLAFDAARAFLRVLLAEQVALAAQRGLDTARADLADTDAQVQAQLVSSNDRTRAQIAVARAERELVRDQGTLGAAYLQLALILNERVAPGLVALEPPDALFAAGARPVPAVGALVASSLARRPDLAARRNLARAAHDSAREPRMRWYPVVDVAAQLTASSQAVQADGSILRGAAGVITLNASWTIFDAGSRDADARSRDAAAAIADLTADALARTIDAEVRGAAALLHNAQRALAAAQGAMAASRKSADETALLYRQQLARAIELLDANEQRFVSEVSFAVAQFEVAGAYLALREAMGLDPAGDQLP